MQIWAELAVAENFCMDFTLLYAAKRAVKNTARVRRIALASSLGASFAVLFPLLPVGGVAAVAVKIAAGLLICAVGGRFRSFKDYLKFTAAFMLLSALLAGALYGIFSLAGISYAEGEGYIFSSVPIGIPLFCALILILGVKRAVAKFSSGNKIEVDCKIRAEGNEVELRGFFDSGNRVYLHGEPVSVVPEGIAKKLVDVERINEGVKIHTVAGSKILKVFTADGLEVSCDGKIQTYKGVRIGISPERIDCAVLHPDLRED